MNSLNADANPGYPYSKLASTKGELVLRYGDFIREVVETRIRDLLEWDGIASTPQKLVENNLCDPIRVFIKNEPHKTTKVAEGRLRLISNVSIVDEIIDRLVSQPQVEAEIANYSTIPAKAGLGFTDAMTQEFYNSLPKDLELASSDVSAWDWRFQSWMFAACLELDVRLCKRPTHEWEKLLHNRTMCLSFKHFMTSDGQAYSQVRPGIQASGSYRTTSWNCKARVMSAYWVGARWAIAMGDDAIEEYEPDHQRQYRKIGVVVTDYLTSSEMLENSGVEYEFCSHHYHPDRAVPLNWVKRLFNLLQHRKSEELLQQFLFESRHDPNLAHCQEIIDQVW